jgi:hypothetical protein
LPADELAIRQILERRAAEENLRTVVGEGSIVTNASVFEVIRNRGFESVVQRAAVPSVRETLQAAKLLQELEASRRPALDLVELRRQIEILLEVVQARVPESEWEILAAEFEARISPRELPPPKEEE